MPFINQNEAVSPVIGVILLVAITVILAAVIAAFVFGMSGTVTPNKIVSCTASVGTVGGVGHLFVTFQGGPDAGDVDCLRADIAGAGFTDLPTGGCDDGTVTPVGASYDAGVLVGERPHVVVKARFTDKTEKVILDTYV